MDGALRTAGIDSGGAEKEVEGGSEYVLNGFDAPGAGGLKSAGKVALEADISDDFAGSAVLVDDFSDAFCGERAGLERFAAQVDGSSREGEVKFNGLTFELGD